MTTPYLILDLKTDEGCRLEAYPDPLSGGAPWTIGYGHTGSDVRPGLTWPQEHAEDALVSDVMRTKASLDRFVAWWRGLDDVRQDVLVNMTFNMGVERLLGFSEMLAALKSKDFLAAAAQMLNSEWARQLPRRADRLAEQMKLGERPTQSHSAPAQGQPALN
jgi:lysozyme